MSETGVYIFSCGWIISGMKFKNTKSEGVTDMDAIRLNNNVQMPLLGLGVFQMTDQTICKEMV